MFSISASTLNEVRCHFRSNVGIYCVLVLWTDILTSNVVS